MAIFFIYISFLSIFLSHIICSLFLLEKLMSHKRKLDMETKNLMKYDQEIIDLQNDIANKKQKIKDLINQIELKLPQHKFLFYKCVIFEKEFQPLHFCIDIFEIIFEYSLCLYLRLFRDHMSEFYVDEVTDLLRVGNNLHG